MSTTLAGYGTTHFRRATRILSLFYVYVMLPKATLVKSVRCVLLDLRSTRPSSSPRITRFTAERVVNASDHSFQALDALVHVLRSCKVLSRSLLHFSRPLADNCPPSWGRVQCQCLLTNRACRGRQRAAAGRLVGRKFSAVHACVFLLTIAACPEPPDRLVTARLPLGYR